MDEHNHVSEGVSSIPRSDLKIGGNERQDLSKIRRVNPIPNSGNTGHDASKDIEKSKELSQIGKVSESFVKRGKDNKTQLLSQEVKPSSSKLDSEKQGLLKKCVTHKGSVLDLKTDSVSSCLNEKSSSTGVNSECGSSNDPVEERDPMKLWKAMKQNGFLSNPHGGMSTTSSSCLVSSSHGGIPAPRKRGRKSKNNEAAMAKKRKIEIARKEEVDRFARLAAPSGLLNELNPGIINHVRNKKQVLSIIENIVKSERDAGNFHHPSMRYSSNTTAGGSRKNFDGVYSRSEFKQGFKYAMPEDGEFSEENSTVGSRFQVGGNFSENASSLSSNDAADLNCASVLTVKAATVSSQWLELLQQDMKGRLTALRRSKKRVRAVVTTELPCIIRKEFSADQENDSNLLIDEASRASTVNIHKNRWMPLFNQLEQKLLEEERQLEFWLSRVREMQSRCNQGLQHLSLSSGQNFLQLGMPLDSRATDALSSDKDLAVRAAAASIFSTYSFLASKENITCT